MEPLTTSAEDQERRVHARGRISEYLQRLPLCHLRERYGKDERVLVVVSQSRILDLCAEPKDRAALSEVLLDFFVWAYDEVVRPRDQGLDQEDNQELVALLGNIDVHEAVALRLYVDPPKENGLEAFAIWALDQKWAGQPLVALLDEDRKRNNQTKDVAAFRLGAARGASGRYEDDGVTLVREPRWSILTALHGVRNALKDPRAQGAA